MARESDVYGLLPSTFTVPAGASAGLLVIGLQNQVGAVLEQLSGGSVYVVGATAGQTYSPADLTSIFAGGTNLFLIQSGKSISIDGSPRFYLLVNGATASMQILNGIGSGY